MDQTKDKNLINQPAGTSGAAAQPATSQWDENRVEGAYTPFEQQVAQFFNRRIIASPKMTLPVHERRMEVVKYYAGGNNLGRLKCHVGSDQHEEIVEVDQSLLDLLLSKIVNV